MSGPSFPPAAAFFSRPFAPLATPVHPLGLALGHGLDAKGMSAALEGGQNFFLLSAGADEAALGVLATQLGRYREHYMVAAAPTLGWFAGSIRRSVDRWRQILKIDYLDLFVLLDVGRTSAWSPATTQALQALREQRIVATLGASCRDRERAATLLTDPTLDTLLVPFSAARPGAERSLFPQIAYERQRRDRPRVVAISATSQRQMLRAPAGYEGRLPSAGDCYRFVASSPYVDVVLSGPRTAEEVQTNLRDFSRGPLGTHEDEWIRHFGGRVRAHEGGGD